VTDPVSDVSGLSTDIVANLTVYNISYEAFSPFTAAYDEVRSVEVAFFLKSTFSVPSLLIPPPLLLFLLRLHLHPGSTTAAHTNSLYILFIDPSASLPDWNAIKRTEGMTNVWASLRSGRSQGFEQVFPLILSQLKYDESSEGGERDVKELF
jgi:hypothetical protein